MYLDEIFPTAQLSIFGVTSPQVLRENRVEKMQRLSWGGGGVWSKRSILLHQYNITEAPWRKHGGLKASGSRSHYPMDQIWRIFFFHKVQVNVVFGPKYVNGTFTSGI